MSTESKPGPVPDDCVTAGEEGCLWRLRVVAGASPGQRARWFSRFARGVAVSAAGVLLLAQCLGGDGESSEGDGAEPAISQAAGTSAGPAPPGTDTTALPPAPGPVSPGPAPPAPATPAPAPTVATAAPLPPPSGPPPVAVGTIPEMRMNSGGLAHALFVAKFFDGPVEGFYAASSDTNVATAGVAPPDLLIVSPVSDGSASITMTASGPGGTATQTFAVRVGPATAAAPAPSPPAAAPAAPPPAAAPAAPPAAPAPAAPPAAPAPAEDTEPFVPEEEIPALAPTPETTTPDGVPLDSLVSDPVTEAPTLSGGIPAVTMIVGQSRTVNMRSSFGGIVQGWSVVSSSPANVRAWMETSGVVSLSGDVLGDSTIMVTATNDAGRAAQGFLVSVKTASQVVLTTVGGSPQVLISVGHTADLDLSRYFSEAATGFDVTYNRADPNRLVDVTVQGSVASIRGLRAGTVRITLVASNSTTRITRPATVQVTG